MAQVETTCARCKTSFMAIRNGVIYCLDCRKAMASVRSAESRKRKLAEDPDAYRARARDWARAARERSPEKSKKAARRWRERHPERAREVQRRYQSKNRARINERARSLYRMDIELSRAKARAYRAANRDYANERRRLNRQKHRILKQAATNPDAWAIVKAPELQTCERLHLRALKLPCGSNEACIGCSRNPNTTESILNRGAWKEGYA